MTIPLRRHESKKPTFLSHMYKFRGRVKWPFVVFVAVVVVVFCVFFFVLFALFARIAQRLNVSERLLFYPYALRR